MNDNDKTILTFDFDDEIEPAKPVTDPAPAGKPESTAEPKPLDVNIETTPANAASEQPALNTQKAQHTQYSPYAKPARKQKKSSKKSGPSYVTTGVFAVCMVITMAVSSVLGAVFGNLFRNDTPVAPPASQNLSESSQSKATGSDLTVAQIIDKNENAVVEIVVSQTSTGFFGEQQVSQGAGSGVIVTADGYIVTNHHVIQNANNVQVTLHNGETYNASIVDSDSENDIAVIKINAKEDLTAVIIGDSSTVDVGDLAVAIGNPLGKLGGTATSGIISALDRRLTIDGNTLTLLQTDAAINPGNSGGGLFNGAGELIGIVDAKSAGTGVEGLAFAIPINSVKSLIDDIITDGKLSGKPAIGITIYDVSESNAQYYNLSGAGVYVAEVTGTNAKNAGFEVGDKIISIDGEECQTGNEFISKVRSHSVGDKVTVVVSRNGQEISIITELEELIFNDQQ